jgi:hypothetical protein
MSIQQEQQPLQWTAFQHGTEVYDLAHLHPCTLEFVRPEKDGKPAVTFVVDVTYSLHCFSRSIPKYDSHDRALEYSDARETRLFDVDRYRLSKRLPGIIETLTERKCQHTGRGNFFTVELVDDSGTKIDYDVFFTASKSSQRGRVNLYIQSAYVKDRSQLPAAKPIRFLIVLHNTLNKIPIKD